MPFKVGSLRPRKSRYTSDDDAGEANDTLPDMPARQQTAPIVESHRKSSSTRRQSIQEFFRNTSSNFRAQTAGLRSSTHGATAKFPGTYRKSRPPPRPSEERAASKRRSRQIEALDIDDDVLDKLMGSQGPSSGSKRQIQSEAFLFKQRVRASDRAVASGELPGGLVLETPLSGTSRAEADRRPLGQEEIEHMFTGAPHFKVERVQSLYRPQVVFRGGGADESRQYGTDYLQFGNEAFAECTMGMRRVREDGSLSKEKVASGEGRATRSPNALFPEEVPSMLTAQGIYPGTIGFEHYLQIPMADNVLHAEKTVDCSAKRKCLTSDAESLGLRELEMETIIGRLNELDSVHNNQQAHEGVPWTDDKIEEMGEDLFGHILDPELGTTSAGTGSVTLRTQIEALHKVLGQDSLWWDFSQVEWRIRVGQLIWSGQCQEKDDDGEEMPGEREIVLLQITLAAELLVRLNALKAITLTTCSFPPPVSQDDQDAISALQRRLSLKLRYDLLLARVFLENVTITTKATADKSANRNSTFSAMTFLTAKEFHVDAELAVEPVVVPKHEMRQLSGLLCFAETLLWPHKDDIERQLGVKLTAGQADTVGSSTPSSLQPPAIANDRPVSGISTYATPLSSPLPLGASPSERRSSYFFSIPSAQQTPTKRPQLDRKGTSASLQLYGARNSTADSEPDPFEFGGWLSKSWLSGFVLPGEAASDFLMSTLLENSGQAIGRLGDEAELYGGFVYQERSYWSKSSVVGRVLAAVKGSKECMGWTSHPIVPTDADDGWLQVDVKDSVMAPAPDGSRIKNGAAITADSDPLHGSQLGSVQAGDFTTPLDGLLTMGNEVRLHSFEMRPLKVHGDDDGPQKAILTFTSPLNRTVPKLEVELRFDVHFIAAYPCHPRTQSHRQSSAPSKPTAIMPATDLPPRTSSLQASIAASTSTRERTLSAPSIPPDSIRTSRASRSTSGITPSLRDIEKELPPPPAHPLHVEYQFTIVPAATLLTAPPPVNSSRDSKSRRSRALSTLSERVRKAQNTLAGDEEIVVLDCRGPSADLALLARAWCAKVGENALVAEVGRTCLACCVREARALDVGVVIRI